jgi:lysyl-tRNA synthetase class II
MYVGWNESGHSAQNILRPQKYLSKNFVRQNRRSKAKEDKDGREENRSFGSDWSGRLEPSRNKGGAILAHLKDFKDLYKVVLDKSDNEELIETITEDHFKVTVMSRCMGAGSYLTVGPLTDVYTAQTDNYYL